MIENSHMLLDALDRRILTQVQRNAKVPLPELAQRVGTSVSSLRRRIRRMRESGVIVREVALLSHHSGGIEIIVLVAMSEEHSVGYARIRRKFADDGAVSQCYRVTGEADMILHVRMPDMERYEAWLEENILSDRAVRRCTSHVVYSRMKFSTEIPLEP